MTTSSTETNHPPASSTNDPATLDRFLGSYTPTTLALKDWQQIAVEAIALVKRAGPYTRPRVQNDISVLAQIAHRAAGRGLPLTLDTLPVRRRPARLRHGPTEHWSRGRHAREDPRHPAPAPGRPSRRPWRRERRPDGKRIVDLPQPGLVQDLARLVATAEHSDCAGSDALLSLVDIARTARRGASTRAVNADQATWRQARAFAHRHGLVLTVRGLAAAVTHEVLLESEPLAVAVADASLTRRDLDLGLTHALGLPECWSLQHRSALRGL